jgi:hypothetical protein
MWLLRRCEPRNDALAGDLEEEYHRRGSTIWYWKQVFAVLALHVWMKGEVVLMKLLTSALAGATSVFATVGFIAVPLLSGGGGWADVTIRMALGSFLLATAALTLSRLWATSTRQFLDDRVLYTAAGVVAVLGAIVVIRDGYYLVRFGDIYSGVIYGDPEYYIPVAGGILLCQGLLTMWHLHGQRREAR